MGSRSRLTRLQKLDDLVGSKKGGVDFHTICILTPTAEFPEGTKRRTHGGLVVEWYTRTKVDFDGTYAALQAAEIAKHLDVLEKAKAEGITTLKPEKGRTSITDAVGDELVEFILYWDGDEELTIDEAIAEAKAFKPEVVRLPPGVKIIKGANIFDLIG